MKRANQAAPPSGAAGPSQSLSPGPSPKRTKLILPKGVTMDNPAIRSALEKLMMSNPGASVVRIVKVPKVSTPNTTKPSASTTSVVVPTPARIPAAPAAPPPPPVIPKKPKVTDDVVAVTQAVGKRVLEELEMKNTRLKEVNRQLEEKTKIVKDKMEKLEAKVGKFLSPTDDQITGHGYNNRTAEQIMTRISRYFPPIVANFFSAQFRNCLRLDNARRWTDNDFLFAFVIYAQSPQCYGFLSKIVAMPPMESLNRWLDKVEVKPDAQIDANEFKNSVLGIVLMKQGEVWCDKLAAGAEGQEMSKTEHPTIEKVMDVPQNARGSWEREGSEPPDLSESVDEAVVIPEPEETTELVVYQQGEDGTYSYELPEEHQIILQAEEGVQEEVVFETPEGDTERQVKEEAPGSEIANLDTFDDLAAAVADLAGTAL